ncbi:two-component sensor histidine kinase [[Synechococcus] sp. NIES-970]|nr:two-component sensor histidine kinase [[Synechococcus] sp. NIES-970]
MIWIPIAIGCGTAAVICFVWQQRQQQQVRKMLYSYSEHPGDELLFTPLSSIRRELKSLYEEKKKLQAELDQWYRVVEYAPFGYLRVDMDNQLILCNPKARQLLCLNRWQEGQIRLLLELVRSYELDQLIEATRKSGVAQSREWEFFPSHDAQTLTDGPNQPVHLRGTTVPLSRGDVAVFLENQEPIHILKRSQEKLLADLTHELRTPLTSMRLLAETLEQRLTGRELKWAGQILKEINRLFYLVQDWLELSHLESHPHQVLSYQTFDLVKLITEAWETLMPLAQQKQVTLQYQGPESLKMTADGDRLTQVFLNLFDNGIKYNPAGEAIIVNLMLLGADPERVTVEVIDQGIGFHPDDLPFIFERLYRGDQARTRQGNSGDLRQGSGLGLAIVQEIIAAHGGEITARNHPKYQGGCLTFTLPLQLPSEDLDA